MTSTPLADSLMPQKRECTHDARFKGVMGLPAGFGGCLACYAEDLQESRDSWRRVAENLQADVDKMMPLVEAVGACNHDQVPETVYKAWRQPSQYQRTCAECGSSR